MRPLKSLLFVSVFSASCGQGHIESEKTNLSAVNPQFVADAAAPYLGAYVGETSGLLSSELCDVVVAENGIVKVRVFDDEDNVTEELKYWGLSEKRITEQDDDTLVFENSDGSHLMGYEKMKLTLKLEDGALDSVKVRYLAVGLHNAWDSLTCKNLKKK
jgi:hypothetical protein